ncbi:MAG: Hsp20/alpha crystallin family protein [Chloroflexi bacterium]|nr:Hsp20/alpha crystallin family protein [Chloroflexota bacterium]
MNSLIRRDPFEGVMSLQKAMDRLMEESFVRPSSLLPNVPGDLVLDMYETDEDVVVKASVPGFKPEDIKITYAANSVTIEGETKAEQEVKEENYFYRERRHGKIARMVALPRPVKGDEATAEFENGVLTLTFPKTEEVKAKSIKVKVK